MNLRRLIAVGTLAPICAILATAPAFGQQYNTATVKEKMESKNMSLLAYSDLDGKGDGGESLALQQRPDGTRILYVPHRGDENCLSVLDVTNPEKPVILNQIPSPAPGITRCDELGLSGNILVIAGQGAGNVPGTGKITAGSGETHILPADVRAKGKDGMWVLDVSDFEKVKTAKKLEDIQISFFNTAGPHSVGIHALWFTDGRFAHLSTGMPDEDPIYDQDDQFYVIVDLKDPKNPREVGRWWYPGTQKGDACLPGCKPKRLVNGYGGAYRPHEIMVPKDQPDRAYLGYIDGGAVILDISGLNDIRSGKATKFTPKLVANLKLNPPDMGFTHTATPYISRKLLVVDSEGSGCTAEGPRPRYLVDIREETNPLIIGTFPYPSNFTELCKRPGMTIHNQDPSGLRGDATSFPLKDTVLTSSGMNGLRLYHFQDQHVPFPKITPPIIEEIGYFIPPPPPKDKGRLDIVYSIVDEKGFIYVIDGNQGGLFILKYTGEVPLS